MDTFYASVKWRNHPELRSGPLVVGHTEEWGVVTAADYEARRYGVRFVMSSQKAKRLCPQLIFVSGGADVYKSVFRQIHEIFHGYIDIIESLSLDEALLDVMESRKGIPLATDIAKEIESRVREQLNLVTFAGVSYNKFLAKIASDYQKLDGLCIIHPDRALDLIAGLPIEFFRGVEPATTKKIHLLGIHNGPQLRKCSLEMLTTYFEKVGTLYYEHSWGIGERPVEAVHIRKSIGCERTLERDTSVHSSVITELHHVAVESIERLRRKEFKGNTLALKVKFHDLNQITRDITQAQELYTLNRILPLAKELLKSVKYGQHPIRLIGLSVSNPRKEADEQYGVWEQFSFEFSDWE